MAGSAARVSSRSYTDPHSIQNRDGNLLAGDFLGLVFGEAERDEGAHLVAGRLAGDVPAPGDEADGRALHRSRFNELCWHPAQERAWITPERERGQKRAPAREDGMHAPRHTAASRGSRPGPTSPAWPHGTATR